MDLYMALINWIVGIFFILSGFTFIGKAFDFALYCFIISSLFIPPIYSRISSKLNLGFLNKFRYLIIIILFFSAVAAYPRELLTENKESVVGDSQKKQQSINQIDSKKEAITVIPTEKPTPTLTSMPTPISLPTSTPKPTMIVYPTNTPDPTELPPIATQTPDGPIGYMCDCGKVCGAMASCDEAYYQLNTCGCSQRDGDHDGVPCEIICN